MTKKNFLDTPKGRILAVAVAITLILAGVLIPLYAVGVLGGEPSKFKRDTEERQELVYQKYALTTSSLPLGKYAKFIFTYQGRNTTLQVYLLSEYAPSTVENFVRYVDAGAYNGTVLWRAGIDYYENTAVRSAYLQAGTYIVEDGTLVKRAPKENYGKVVGEFAENGYEKNVVSHTAGILTMIHPENENDGADTDFMFLPKDYTELNGKYAPFGMVVDSDACDTLFSFTQAIVSSPTAYPVTIQSVTIYEKSK